MHHIIVQGGLYRKNKILVHCHAGQGRTAIIIGAYILYAGLVQSAEEAIHLCQQGRPKLFVKKYNRIYLA
jgi:protein-tyrosine phosphatase